jgi:hypothetical protein
MDNLISHSKHTVVKLAHVFTLVSHSDKLAAIVKTNIIKCY